MAIRSRASATYDIRTRDRSTPEVRKIKKEFGGLDEKLTKFGIGLGKTTLATAAGLTAIYTVQSNLIDTIGKTSESLGIGVERWQAYTDAAERAGLKSTTVERAIEKMQVNIGKAAQGLSTQKRAFDDLNLSFEDLRSLNPDEKYRQITTALAGVEDQGRRAQIATDIFGGNGPRVLRLTAEAIDESAEKMERLSIALTETDVAAVEAANDSMQELGKYAGQNAKIFTSELAPAVNAVSKQVLLALESFGESREVSRIFADSFITAIGGIGDGINLLRKEYYGLDALATGILASGVGVLDQLFGSNEKGKANLAFLNSELERIQGNIRELNSTESFSDRLTANYEEIRKRNDLAAESIERLRTAANGPIEVGGDSGVRSQLDSAAADAEKERSARLKREIEANREKSRIVLNIAKAEQEERARIVSEFGSAQDSIRTETQIILDSYQDRQSAVSAYYKLEGSDKRAANDAQIALALELKDKLLAIEDEKNEALIQKDRERAERSRQIGADIGLASLDLLKREVEGRIELNDQMSEAEREAAEKQNAINKKKFKQNQIYASAQALINTYLGISQVLGDSTLTFGQKIGAVAAVSLEGLAAIRTIKSAKFGSTSSTGSGGNLSSGSGGSGGSNSGRLTDQPSGAQPIFVVLRDDGMTDPRKFGANVAKAVVKLNQDHDLNIDLDTGEIESNLATA